MNELSTPTWRMMYTQTHNRLIKTTTLTTNKNNTNNVVILPKQNIV